MTRRRRGVLGWDGTDRTLLLLIAAALAGFGLRDGFLTMATLQAIAFQMPELGILSLAMMVSLLSGGINLAIIATANLSALAMAFVLTRWLPGSEGPAWVLWQGAALAAGAGVAVVAGLLNGALVARLGVSPILATLGSMTLMKGVALGLTRGEVLSGFPDAVVFLGNGTILGVPAALLPFAAAALLMAVLLGRTPLGAAVAMIGANEKAARFSGIDTGRTLVKVYVASSLLAALAGLVMMARFNSANASYGESYLLVTILVCVLGGTRPSGGAGTVGGLVLALVLLQIVSSGLNQLGVSAFLTLAIWGLILVAVAGLSALRRRHPG